MSRLLKYFLAFAGFLGISTIALCSFIILNTTNSEEIKHSETILATKIIACGKNITPSDSFWTENKFK